MKRPLVLSALCILSFIGSGFQALLFLLATIFYNHSLLFIQSHALGGILNNVPRTYFAALAGVAILSFCGVLLMWKLQRKGFFIYFVGQTGLFLLPVFILSRNTFSAVNLMTILFFLVLYLIQWKHLK